MDRYRSRRSLDFLAPPSQLVEPRTGPLERRHHRRHLHDVTPKTFQNRLHLTLGDRKRFPLQHRPGDIEGVGGHPQLGASSILLGKVLNEARQASGPAHTENEETGGHRVEGTGMPHFGSPEQAPHSRHNVV